MSHEPDDWAGDDEVGGTLVRCESDAPAQPGTHWIEIELVGEDDAPIIGERYRLVLDDGRVLEGVIGRSGVVRVESLGAAPCRLEFPRLDGEAWEPA